MGMGVVVDVRDAGVDDAAAEEVFDWLRFVDDTFSTYKPESEVSRIERGELSPEEAHPDVGEVLGRCEELREDTHGYFDSEASGSLDPSGLVKGWAVDRAAEILEAAGARNFAIYAGGDVIVRGHGRSPAIAGTSESDTPSVRTGWPRSSRRTTSQSPRRAGMPAASTSSTLTPAVLPRACSR